MGSGSPFRAEVRKLASESIDGLALARRSLAIHLSVGSAKGVMRRCSVSILTGLRRPVPRRAVALLALSALVIGSVGIPVLPETNGANATPPLTTHHSLSPQAVLATSAPTVEPARCCCSRKSKPCTCGCRHTVRETARTPSARSCCQSKSLPKAVATTTARGPSIGCPCEKSPTEKLLVSSQPKLAGRSVRFEWRGDCREAVVVVSASRPDRTLPPPVPPPRLSIG